MPVPSLQESSVKQSTYQLAFKSSGPIYVFIYSYPCSEMLCAVSLQVTLVNFPPLICSRYGFSLSLKRGGVKKALFGGPALRKSACDILIAGDVVEKSKYH